MIGRQQRKLDYGRIKILYKSGYGPTEISEITGYKYSSVRRALRVLKKDGEIVFRK
jgi:DNA-binding MarR family transcriptional regulator